MEEIFAKHYETLQVKDGNFYNDKEIIPALKYFKKRLLLGGNIEKIEPLLEIIVRETSGILLNDVSVLLVLYYFKSNRYADIFRLGNRVYPEILNKVFEKIDVETNVDIFPIFQYAVEHKLLEIFDIKNSLKRYFDHEKNLTNRLSRRLEVADKIVDKEINTTYLASLIHHLLSKYFPQDCFRLLKKLLYQKAHAYDSMNYLLGYLPDYQEDLKEDIGYIESLMLQYNTGNYWNYANYHLKNLLLKYYFYRDNFEVVKKLVQIQEGYDAHRSVYNLLVELIVKHPEKTDQYFPLILDAFKEDNNFLTKSLKKCFEKLREEKFELKVDFLNVLIQNLDTQNKIRLSLEALLAYHADILFLKKSNSKNPYFLGLIDYYDNYEQEYCEFCASKPISIYKDIDLTQLEKKFEYDNIKSNASYTESFSSWVKCKTCGQDYIYSYEENFDLIRQIYDSLTKTNPADLLQKITDPEIIKNIHSAYPQELERAQKSVYSPVSNLRIPAAKFLTLHYIRERDKKGLEEFLKNLASDCLSVAFESVYFHLYNGKYPFSEVDFLNHLSDVEYSQYDLGRIVMVDLMLKNDQSGMLKCLNSDNREFLRGLFSLMTIGYGPFKDFTFNPEIFELVYKKGIESGVLFYDISEFISKKEYSSDAVNIHVMMRTLEKTEDPNSISFLLNVLSGLKKELPALHESIVHKLLKLSDIKEIETKAADFLTEMFKLNKVQREGLLLIADYFIDNKAFICNEYLVNVLDIKNRKDDFVYTYFICTQNEPYFWLSKFNLILKESKDHIVQSCLIKTINNFAEKGIDIEPLLDELINKINNPDNFLRAETKQVLKNYYQHYKHSFLLPYLN